MKNIRALLNQYSHLKLINYTDFDNSETNENNIFLYPNTLSKVEILNKVSSSQMSCLINCNGINFKSELATAINIKANPSEFIKNPLQALFQKTHFSLKLNFNRDSNKNNLINEIELFLGATHSRLVTENSRILFEELYMNALFDAPKEAQLKGLNIPALDAEMIIAYDDSKVIISCLDHYGLLDTKSFMQRISKIISLGTNQTMNFDRNKGGAGIGSSLIYRYSSTLCLVVDKNQYTRVTVTIPLKMSHKKFETLKKNIQIIELNTLEETHGKQRKV